MPSSVCVVGVQLDVNGECETKYVIKSRESSSLSSVSDMLVSKVKNLDKCTKRNSFELGLFAGLPHYDTEKVRRRPRRLSSTRMHTSRRYRRHHHHHHHHLFAQNSSGTTRPDIRHLQLPTI